MGAGEAVGAGAGVGVAAGAAARGSIPVGLAVGVEVGVVAGAGAAAGEGADAGVRAGAAVGAGLETRAPVGAGAGFLPRPQAASSTILESTPASTHLHKDIPTPSASLVCPMESGCQGRLTRIYFTRRNTCCQSRAFSHYP